MENNKVCFILRKSFASMCSVCSVWSVYPSLYLSFSRNLQVNFYADSTPFHWKLSYLNSVLDHLELFLWIQKHSNTPGPSTECLSKQLYKKLFRSATLTASCSLHNSSSPGTHVCILFFQPLSTSIIDGHFVGFSASRNGFALTARHECRQPSETVRWWLIHCFLL